MITFIKHAQIACRNVDCKIQIPNIYYKSIKKNAAGYYHRIHDHIIINKRIWKTMSPIFQEVVLLHELGHGALRRKHDNRLMKDGCGASIMLYNISETCYTKYREYYLKELFEKRNEFEKSYR